MNCAQTNFPAAIDIPAQSTEESPQGELSHWLNPGRFAALLFLLVAAMFWNVLAGNETFVFRDYALFGYPLALHHREAFWAGEIPLWNPLNNFGLPYVAQWNTMVFYPFSLIYLLLPLPLSLGLFCLFHMFLAGFGMYLLSLRWTNNRTAAGFAGISYAFSGLTLSCLIWPNNIAALGWLPWVWLFVEKGCVSGGKNLLIAVLAGSCQMLSGAPEVILFTWVIVSILLAVQFRSSKGGRRILVMRAAGIVMLIGAVCAVQLLPFLDLLVHSHRQVESSGAEWSLPATGWANFLVPLFNSVQTSMGVYLQPNQGWTSSYYLGCIGMVLAILAGWKVRNPLVASYAILAGMAIILASGEHAHFYTWLRELFPQVGIMRYPVKFVLFAAVLVPWLGAVALAYWLRVEKPKARELSGSLLFLGLGALLCIGIILYVGRLFPDRLDDYGNLAKNGFVRAGLLIAALFILCALARAEHSVNRLRRVLAVALLGLTWVDLASHVPNQNPPVSSEAYTLELPPLKNFDPMPAYGSSRAMISWGSLVKLHSTFVSNTVEWVIGLRLGMHDNCNLIDRVPKSDGFWSLYLHEAQQIRKSLLANTNIHGSPLADFVGISQVSSEAKFLEWESRRSWMPLMTAGQKPLFVSTKAVLPLVCAPSFNPRETVLLPTEAQAFLGNTNKASVLITNQTFARQRITAQTEANDSSVLVIAQTYYHPWKAYIDGEPARIWKANYAFQAVALPAGTHNVELRYEDQAFKWGVWISSGALLVCAILYWRSRKAQSGFQLIPLSAF